MNFKKILMVIFMILGLGLAAGCGYPIWWYQEPMIIDTFLESGDFSGKTIVPFCTSGGSSIDKSIEHMKTVVKGASFAQGFRYDGNDKEMNQWLNSLGLLKK